MNNYKSFSNSFLIILTVIISFAANAQKLPTVQKISLRAPSNIKIDGKATEWDNKFQALNKVTNLYYTLANNDEFIYMIVHCKNGNDIFRICYYGFTFSINNQKKIGGTDLVSMQFPFDQEKGHPLSLNYRGVPIDTSVILIESDMISNNKNLPKQHRSIKIKGIKGLDTLSIYNDTGIRVAEAMDRNKNYTLEIAIPIKYISFLKAGVSKINYNIQINSINENMFPKAPPTADMEMIQAIAEMNAEFAAEHGASNFWGEYTLL